MQQPDLEVTPPPAISVGATPPGGSEDPSDIKLSNKVPFDADGGDAIW